MPAYRYTPVVRCRQCSVYFIIYVIFTDLRLYIIFELSPSGRLTVDGATGRPRACPTATARLGRLRLRVRLSLSL
jgi:hypothetical protein